MKKYVLVNLIAIFAAVITGAFGAPVSGQAAQRRISVVSTIFPPYDFARAIAGGKAEITMLLPPDAESHTYDPTPRDIIKIQNSDVFIHTGGTDEWVQKILSATDKGRMKVITLMDCVDVVEEETAEGMEEEEDEGRGGKEYDEHVWTSPANAKKIVRAISAAMCEADGENADFYRKNTAAYLAELDKLDGEFRNAVKSASRRTIVIAGRFPFRYLADAYGLKYFAAFPGCSTETEPSAATVTFLINKVRSEKIPVVFHIELSSEKMADIICEETGAKKLLLHSCHNISDRDFKNGVTYLDLMRKNVKAIEAALR